MTDGNVGAASDFTGQIPENYDRSLGPVLFEPFARDLTRRAAVLSPSNVLELAAGTGIVTRMLRDSLPASCSLTATDLNAPMLDVARKKFGAAETVTFQPADAISLPFADQAFDMIACQFGVMFFPDKVASFNEARRVLKPGGAYIFNVWGPMEANPMSGIVFDIGTRFFPYRPPGFYRVPFSYSDIPRVEADLGEAGFSNVRHDTLKIEQPVANWAHFARGIVYGNPLIAEIEARKQVSADAFMAAVIEALQAQFGPSPARLPLEANVFTAQA